MQILNWSDSYSVGISAMDAEHKKLIDIINELYVAMNSGKGNDALANVIRSLIDYTQLHFRDEEALMLANKFPGLDEQKSEHVALVEKVLDFQKRFQSGSFVMSFEVFEFLSDWLTHHIVSMDKKYGEFLNAKGIH